MVSETPKLKLTKLLVEAVKFVGKPKSSLKFLPKRSRKQDKQVKNSLLT